MKREIIVYEDYNKGTPLDGQAELSAEFAADSGETGIRIDFGSTDKLVEKRFTSSMSRLQESHRLTLSPTVSMTYAL